MSETPSSLELNVADRELFQQLRRKLEREIANYVYEVPEGAIGTPLHTETISNYLDSMRRCLMEPH